MISSNLINLIVDYIGYNPLIDFECKFLNENLDKWDWYELSGNLDIPYSFLKNHTDKIVWSNLCYKKDMPLEFIENHYNEIQCIGSDFPESFIEHALITDTLKHLINFSDLCDRDDLSVEFYEKHLDQLDWKALCENENIPNSFFEKYIKHKKYKHFMNWHNLSKRFPLHLLEKNLDKINWYSIGLNPNLTINFIEKYDNVDWNYRSLYQNESLPISYFEKLVNEDKMDWQIICVNENIPISFFEKYIDKIDFHFLSENKNIPYTFFISKIESDKKENNIDFKKIKNHFRKRICFEIENIDKENKEKDNDKFYLSNYLQKSETFMIFEKLSYIDNIDEYIKEYINECFKIDVIINDNDLKPYLNEVFNKLNDKVDFVELSNNENLSYKFYEYCLDKVELSNKIIWPKIVKNNTVPLSFLLKCIDLGKITWKDLSSSYRITYEDNTNEMKKILSKLI